MKNLKLSAYIAGITIIFAASCSNDDAKTLVNEVPDVELLDGNILKFKDQATFDRYVAQKQEAPDGFYSIYQHFDEAMSEAEAYYPRQGGYFEFKDKYSALYFPEQGTDYGAYLPVSDEVKAKYLNLNCEVKIGDELKNFKDVQTYTKLQELGKAVPEFIQQNTRDLDNNPVEIRTIYNDTNGLYKTYSSGGGRVIWVNIHRKITDSSHDIAEMIIEVCYRKREKIIFWIDYNYYAGSVISSSRLEPRYSPINSFSSHNHSYQITTFREGGSLYMGAVQSQVVLKHSSWSGDEFRININLPAKKVTWEDYVPDFI